MSTDSVIAAVIIALSGWAVLLTGLVTLVIGIVRASVMVSILGVLIIVAGAIIESAAIDVRKLTSQDGETDASARTPPQ